MSAITFGPATVAFERLGVIREHLTALEDLAAELDDDELSRQIVTAKRANTIALARAHTLLQLDRQTTNAADADLDSQNVGGARGG